MYNHILVTLDTSACDKHVLNHIHQLASLCHSHVTLLHVADGWAARRFGQDAVSPEVTADSAYLDTLKANLIAAGIPTTSALLYGDPKIEILKYLDAHPIDLLAMATHGHRFVGDLLFGATATHVQHRTNVPVLLLRAKPTSTKPHELPPRD